LAIERDASELLDMYKDLQSLVNSQQEGLDTITDNVIETKSETADALTQLQSAEKLQRGARKKQCCLLFIIVIVLAVIGVGGYLLTR